MNAKFLKFVTLISCLGLIVLTGCGGPEEPAFDEEPVFEREEPAEPGDTPEEGGFEEGF